MKMQRQLSKFKLSSPCLSKGVGGRWGLKPGTLRGPVCRGHVPHSRSSARTSYATLDRPTEPSLRISPVKRAAPTCSSTKASSTRGCPQELCNQLGTLSCPLSYPDHLNGLISTRFEIAYKKER